MKKPNYRLWYESLVTFLLWVPLEKNSHKRFFKPDFNWKNRKIFYQRQTLLSKLSSSASCHSRSMAQHSIKNTRRLEADSLNCSPWALFFSFYYFFLLFFFLFFSFILFFSHPLYPSPAPSYLLFYLLSFFFSFFYYILF